MAQAVNSTKTNAPLSGAFVFVRSVNNEWPVRYSPFTIYYSPLKTRLGIFRNFAVDVRSLVG